MNTEKRIIYFKFRRNISVFFVFILTISILGGVSLFFLLIPTIRTILSNTEFISIYEIVANLLISSILIGIPFYILRRMIVESSVEFSQYAIRSSGILHTRSIRWDEMISVNRLGAIVMFVSKNERIKINLWYYKEPEKIVELINERTNITFCGK